MSVGGWSSADVASTVDVEVITVTDAASQAARQPRPLGWVDAHLLGRVIVRYSSRADPPLRLRSLKMEGIANELLVITVDFGQFFIPTCYIWKAEYCMWYSVRQVSGWHQDFWKNCGCIFMKFHSVTGCEIGMGIKVMGWWGFQMCRKTWHWFITLIKSSLLTFTTCQVVPLYV